MPIAESIINKKFIKKIGVIFILNILIISILIPAVYSANIEVIKKNITRIRF